MKSIIHDADRVPNTARKFGSAKHYYVATLRTDVAGDIPLLFTEHDINDAINRAAKNPEDVPQRTGLLARFLAWLR